MQNILQSNSCWRSSIGRTWGDRKVQRASTKRNIIVEGWRGHWGEGTGEEGTETGWWRDGEEGEETQKILQSNSCSLSSIGRTWGDQKVRRTPTKTNIIVEGWTEPRRGA